MSNISQRLRQDFTSEKGVAGVEMALTFTVLLALLIPMIDVAQIAYTGMRLNSAVRTGAQFAMSYPDSDSDIQSVVTQATNLPSASVTATITTSCECNSSSVSCAATCAGTMATFKTITASYNMPLVAGYSGFTNPYPVSKQSVVRVE